MDKTKHVDIHGDIKYLYQQASSAKRFNISRVPCIIKSLVPQGDLLFAIARYPDQTVTAKDGITQSTVKGDYIGNEAHIDESKLVLSEILIQTNINLKNYKGFDIKSFIGQQAEAEFYDGRPLRLLVDPNTINSRVIPNQVIQAARSTNSAQDLSHPNAKSYIQNAGYDLTDFNNLLKESIKDINPDNYVLVYGKNQDWARQSQQDLKTDASYKDISQFVTGSTVLGLPTSILKSFICYSPPVFFSGF